MDASGSQKTNGPTNREATETVFYQNTRDRTNPVLVTDQRLVLGSESWGGTPGG